jgi:NAD(P)-dependent dehydrogenase (short-subunit alcohol dehydrogenase family)
MSTPHAKMFDITGKTAVITGSSRGIGKAIALRMAEAGAKVVVSSRKLDACETVVDEIVSSGGEALAATCNIAEKSQLQDLVDKAIEAYGRIDILVCNAAVNPYYGRNQDIPDEAFDRILDCNVRSNHWLCQMAIPAMAARGDGVVIIVSSIAGLRGSTGIGTYGISKAADMQLAKNLALEWGPSNVRVNCIAPGLVRTDFARALWENPKVHDRVCANTPLRRIGEPDDIAGTALFLASPAAGFLTGQTIVVDGGVLIGSSLG